MQSFPPVGVSHSSKPGHSLVTGCAGCLQASLGIWGDGQHTSTGTPLLLEVHCTAISLTSPSASQNRVSIANPLGRSVTSPPQGSENGLSSCSTLSGTLLCNAISVQHAKTDSVFPNQISKTKPHHRDVVSSVFSVWVMQARAGTERDAVNTNLKSPVVRSSQFSADTGWQTHSEKTGR